MAPDDAQARPGKPSRVRRWAWLNGLALVMFGAFIVFAVLQSIFGWQVRNEELLQVGQPTDSFWHYLGTGHFGEAMFENWESEFLQLGSYVLLTAYLVQRGSPESKPLDQDDRPADQPDRATATSPALSRALGFTGALYRNSLSLVLLAFFALSFIAHLLARHRRLQRAAGTPVRGAGHLGRAVPGHT